MSPVTPPELTVFVGAPDAFAARAEGVLRTLLAPLGRRAAVTRDPAQASGASKSRTDRARPTRTSERMISPGGRICAGV